MSHRADRDPLFSLKIRQTHVAGVIFNFILADEVDAKVKYFSQAFLSEPITYLPLRANFWDLLVVAGAFPSKGQARKNWKGQVEVPNGYSEFEVACGNKRYAFFIYKHDGEQLKDEYWEDAK